jgi:hypothetical protein
MIDWSRATRDDVLAINSIAKLACTLDPTLDVLAVQMDLEACHTHGCPLDLDRMAEARQGDVLHDIAGIRRHLDRETGELTDCFVPRFARVG